MPTDGDWPHAFIAENKKSNDFMLKHVEMMTKVQMHFKLHKRLLQLKEQVSINRKGKVYLLFFISVHCL